MIVKSWIMVIGLVLITAGVGAQGFFDEPEGKPFDIKGFGRSVLYVAGDDGRPGLSSLYGEAGLSFKYYPDQRFRLFTEVRLRGGYEYNDAILRPQVRDLYGELHLGRFHIRAGQQVVAWGRADAFNPTDNITPKDFFVRSPEPDDLRIGNYLFRTTFRINEYFTLEGIWVPVYRYSVYRFDLFDMPGFVTFKQPGYAAWRSHGGNMALKFDFFFPALDGSVSIFNGFDPQPGINLRNRSLDLISGISLGMGPEAFRQTTVGADFATTTGRFGLRGELGIRIPGNDYKNEIYCPQQDVRYVFGLDRSMGKFSILVQYSGQWIPGFSSMPELVLFDNSEAVPIPEPFSFDELDRSIDDQIKGFNRLIFGQSHRISHTLMLRPSVSFLFETLQCELFASYNMNTEEYNIDGRISYRFSDHLGLTVGFQYFDGPDLSVYEMIRPVLSGSYMELRYSF